MDRVRRRRGGALGPHLRHAGSARRSTAPRGAARHYVIAGLVADACGPRAARARRGLRASAPCIACCAAFRARLSGHRRVEPRRSSAVASSSPRIRSAPSRSPPSSSTSRGDAFDVIILDDVFLSLPDAEDARRDRQGHRRTWRARESVLVISLVNPLKAPLLWAACRAALPGPAAAHLREHPRDPAARRSLDGEGLHEPQGRGTTRSSTAPPVSGVDGLRCAGARRSRSEDRSVAIAAPRGARFSAPPR